MVYVISKDKKPLMPCDNVIARLLLKQGKAKIVHRCPFTIKLLQESTEHVQKCTLGIDPGSGTMGSAVVDDIGRVLYASEIVVRNDITKKMKQRRMYRRNRRSKYLRFRPNRYLNRKNNRRKNRFMPTIISKIDSHLKEIKFVKSILPISKIILEIAQFDMQILKNPDILKNKELYQKGTLYGYENMKAYVLERDGYKCQSCNGKSKEKRLHVHHIVFRKNDGGDEPENLITLCIDCHDKVHNKKIELKTNGKKRNNFKYASHMNMIISQLKKKLNEFVETYGYKTNYYRKIFNLHKSHYNDAIIIACEHKQIKFKVESILYKRCIADGDYQKRKVSNKKNFILRRKIHGFCRYDKIRYKGKEYFINTRRQKGYFEYVNIFWEKINISPIYKINLKNTKRIISRKSWIMDSIKIT